MTGEPPNGDWRTSDPWVRAGSVGLLIDRHADGSAALDAWAADLMPEFAQGLSERAWTILRLIYFTGLSQREVASRLRLTVSEVANEVARSLQIVSGIVLTPQ